MTRDKTGRTSGGILLWRRGSAGLQVLLAHPGGPFFAAKDVGHWTIPKGEADDATEALADVARREFHEETGHPAPGGEQIPLGEILQKSGKRVVAWALEGDLDPATAVSNAFPMEWPPHSGRIVEFPEIDRVAWFGLGEARERLKAAQVPFLDRLDEALVAGDARGAGDAPGGGGLPGAGDALGAGDGSGAGG
jgi:predicted NUDIX family NTP pyrophosphohydrolase